MKKFNPFFINLVLAAILTVIEIIIYTKILNYQRCSYPMTCYSFNTDTIISGAAFYVYVFFIINIIVLYLIEFIYRLIKKHKKF